MSHILEAKVIFEVDDENLRPDWELHQDVLVQLKNIVQAAKFPHVLGDPQVNKIIPKAVK